MYKIRKCLEKGQVVVYSYRMQYTSTIGPVLIKRIETK